VLAQAQSGTSHSPRWRRRHLSAGHQNTTGSPDPQRRVIELMVRRVSVLDCGMRESDGVQPADVEMPPRSALARGLLKPTVVLFGEAMPIAPRGGFRLAKAADVMLVWAVSCVPARTFLSKPSRPARPDVVNATHSARPPRDGGSMGLGEVLPELAEICQPLRTVRLRRSYAGVDTRRPSHRCRLRSLDDSSPSSMRTLCDVSKGAPPGDHLRRRRRCPVAEGGRSRPAACLATHPAARAIRRPLRLIPIRNRLRTDDSTRIPPTFRPPSNSLATSGARLFRKPPRGHPAPAEESRASTNETSSPCLRRLHRARRPRPLSDGPRHHRPDWQSRATSWSCHDPPQNLRLIHQALSLQYEAPPRRDAHGHDVLSVLLLGLMMIAPRSFTPQSHRTHRVCRAARWHRIQLEALLPR